MNMLNKSLLAGLLCASAVAYGAQSPEASRPQPLRSMECRKTLDASAFGAIPDDGKDDWRALTRAFEALAEAADGEPVQLKSAAERYDNTLSNPAPTHCLSA